MTSRLFRYFLLGWTVLSLSAVPAYCQGNGHGKGQEKHKDRGGDEEDRRERGRPRFGPHDRDIIVGYYSGRGSNLPPGLAKRGGNLPPGLEKHLERDGTLPPGLQKRLQPCPADLERQLPRLPADYRRGVIGTHIVILNRRTNVIMDVLKDVAR